MPQQVYRRTFNDINEDDSRSKIDGLPFCQRFTAAELTPVFDSNQEITSRYQQKKKEKIWTP